MGDVMAYFFLRAAFFAVFFAAALAFFLAMSVTSFLLVKLTCPRSKSKSFLPIAHFFVAIVQCGTHLEYRPLEGSSLK